MSECSSSTRTDGDIDAIRAARVGWEWAGTPIQELNGSGLAIRAGWCVATRSGFSLGFDTFILWLQSINVQLSEE